MRLILGSKAGPRGAFGIGLLAALVAVFAMILITDPASSATQPRLHVSPKAAYPGEVVTTTGSGFPARVKGSITFGGRVVATFTTSSSGRFAKRWRIPAAAQSGVVRAKVSSRRANVALKVLAPVSPPPVAPAPSPAPDDDGDGVVDSKDNCPGLTNTGQSDVDADGRGDACDGTDNRHGLSPDNAPQENRRALEAAMEGTANDISLPPGDYKIYNTGRYEDGSFVAPLTVENFSGSLTMREGARLVFVNKTRGIIFRGGTGARFHNLSSAFVDRPGKRVGAQELFQFSHTVDTLVNGAEIDGSAAAGILFDQSYRPIVKDAVIRNTMADGLHFANSQDARAEYITAENVGDDGLAFLNYGGREDLFGGFATDITVKGGLARGITVIGQRNVEIQNFYVENTHTNGVHVAQEDAYNTRIPSNVYVHDGEVQRAGKLLKNGAAASNRFSLFYNGVLSTRFENVTSRCPDNTHTGTGAKRGEITFTSITRVDAC